MKASTHTEIYRPFRGTLAARRSRWKPLALSTLRGALRKKLPLLLFAPPAIATVIFSFVVYAKFALEAGTNPLPGTEDGRASPMAAVGGMAGNLIEVRTQIIGFHAAMDFFVLLIVAWYGSGLIAEDARRKAHLLYFARPLTRLDYLLGKWLPLVLMGACGTLLPGLVICSVAAFASPNWSFVTQEGDTILKMIAYSLVSLVVQTSIVLAISSLAQRKTHALAVSLGCFALLGGLGSMLARLVHEPAWNLLSVFGCLRRVSAGLFDVQRILHFRANWSLAATWFVLAGWVLVAWVVLFWRTRRLEQNG
ncbi:MAG: ABC transporter permease subunit [Planctomycetes bacterium]|nr:ABC transporter permease subunit [Planctomycetota bacterium]